MLPARDAGKTLQRALETVLESSFRDFELICIDDGSRDETPEILASCAKDDARVVNLRQAPRGIVAALNNGLTRARAPLVARMDADDEMHPARLGAQRARLLAEPELALVGCKVESFREGGLGAGYRIYTQWVNGLLRADEIRRECFVECPIPHPTWMFRRELVSALGGYRERPWPEDLDLLYRLFAAGWSVAKLDHTLHRWRDHPSRASRVDPRYDRKAFARAKAHFIGQLHPMSAAVVWGAGRTGRRFVRLLGAEGIPTRALLDIHPDRQGTRWRGIPILAPEALPEHAERWRVEGVRVLAAVASRGARAEIRHRLRSWGLEEGRDFTMVA